MFMSLLLALQLGSSHDSGDSHSRGGTPVFLGAQMAN